MKLLPSIHPGILRIRKWAIVTGLFLLVMGQTAWPLLAQAPQPTNSLEATLAAQTTARVIVALRVPPTSGEIAIQQTQDNLLQRMSPNEFHLLHQYETLPGLVGEVTPAGLTALQNQPDVAAVALDLPVQTAFTTSAAFIKVDAVFNQFGLTGEGINVAVLDTGVDVAHLDLADRIVAQHCFSRNGCLPAGLPESDNAQDEQGHGTHVAGIIAGQGLTSPRGLTPGVGLVAVRVLGSTGSGFTSDVLAGLDWVVVHQATVPVNIINLSLGGGSYEGTCDQADANTMLYAAAVERATAAGITVFAAAGNGGQADKLMAPACVSGVVAVGNVYDAPLAQLSWPTCVDQNIQADQVTCSSNSSSALDLLAPGVSITSAKLGGGQTTLSGTSMSTPHAAAVAALLLQADPSLTPVDVEELLQASGVPVTDPRNNQTTPRIDALAAITQITGSEAMTLTGTVLLEGRANHSGTQIFVSDGPCSTLFPENPTTTTQADGKFEIISFTKSSPQCLQVRQAGYLVGQRETSIGNLGTITLPGGDVTGDGVIDIFDLALMASRYGTKDLQADLTGNGLVDIFDLAIAAKNYERVGPVSGWK